MNEQLLIDIIYFFTYSIPQAYIFYICLNCMLTPKSKKAKIISLTVCPIINLMCFTALVKLPQELNFVMSVLMILIPAMLLFKESAVKRLLSSIMLLLIFLLFDIVIANIVLDVFGYYPNKLENMNWDSVYAALAADFMMITCVFPISLFWGRKTKNLRSESMGLFFLFPVSQALFISACTYGFWKEHKFDIFNNIFVPLAVVFSIFADIAMYRALKKNSEYEDMRLRMLEMEHNLEIQYQYYDSLTKKYEEIREYRHDINNLVSAVEALVQKNISLSEGEKLAESLREKALDTAVPVFCANPIVNTVIWQKKQKAEKCGIKFEIDMNISEDFPIDRVDICSLFANILDNAISEAQCHENAVVTIRAAREMGLLFIEITNPVEHDFPSDALKLKTTKTGENHGHGIEIIKKITEKYNGNFILKAENGKVIAKACINIQK